MTQTRKHHTYAWVADSMCIFNKLSQTSHGVIYSVPLESINDLDGVLSECCDGNFFSVSFAGLSVAEAIDELKIHISEFCKSRRRLCEVEVNPSNPHEPFLVGRVLEQIEDLVGKKTIIHLHGFDLLAKEYGDLALERSLRSRAQFFRNISLVFTSPDDDALRAMALSKQRPFYRSLNVLTDYA